MTREEIIEQLDGIVGTYEIFIGNGVNSDILDVDDIEAIKEAISALSENKGELISGEAVLAIIEREEFKGDAIAEIEKLPSVENRGEQRPKGHWITQRNIAHQKDYYYCSECREEFSYDGETGIKMSDYNFCPNCGADMRGET